MKQRIFSISLAALLIIASAAGCAKPPVPSPGSSDMPQMTGGIVQGMSGSPILQDGKLVGAVTHVFVNDPTKGFAIFAENMLKTASSAVDSQAAA